MNKIIYEVEHKKSGHFSFGKNWRDYLTQLTPEQIAIAEASLVSFLGGKDKIEGKTFIDFGCGSGIFSLAAYRLKAKSVVSVDIDEASLNCVRFLHQEAGKPQNWKILKGSALNDAFFKSLGQFDIVYSWGVLHHTGEMKRAIQNVTKLVNTNGKLFISIYNDSLGLMHGKSAFWLKIKRKYNHSNSFIKQIYIWVYSAYLFLGLCLTLQNPFTYIHNYKSMRGMSWKHDILDWLGGYPYEYASPEKVVRLLSRLGFSLQNSILVNTIGCNEFLFTRNVSRDALPQVTALISIHNSSGKLDKTFTSIFAQTVPVQVICINDASTDNTESILREWKQKVGSKLEIIVNKQNLGLTKSLNKGLKNIKTPFTARIDADDWWDETKLEKQLNFLMANPEYGIIGSWYTNHSHHRNYLRKPPMTDQRIRQVILNQNPFAHSCVVYKTKLVSDLGGYDESARYGQDYELWLRCLPKTKFFNFPQNLCHRTFIGGISIEKQHDQMRQAIKTRVKYIRDNQLSLWSYRSIVEPWIVSITPRWIADIKRRLSDR